MSKITSIFGNVWSNVLANIIVVVLLALIGWVTGFFRTQDLDTQLLIIAIALLVVVLLNLQILLWAIYRVTFPKKPALVKAYNEPATYIYLHRQWRQIPDWQTRDYLAHVLGFRPGEEDITPKPKDEVDKLQKGAPLESIITYAR